jgi:hypothetical protein
MEENEATRKWEIKYAREQKEAKIRETSEQRSHL